MTDTVIVNADTGEEERRAMTDEEQAQLDADQAEAQARADEEAADDAERDADNSRRDELAGKAKAGTLTDAERDEALALALAR